MSEGKKWGQANNALLLYEEIFNKRPNTLRFGNPDDDICGENPKKTGAIFCNVTDIVSERVFDQMQFENAPEGLTEPQSCLFSNLRFNMPKIYVVRTAYFMPKQFVKLFIFVAAGVCGLNEIAKISHYNNRINPQKNYRKKYPCICSKDNINEPLLSDNMRKQTFDDKKNRLITGWPTNNERIEICQQ